MLDPSVAGHLTAIRALHPGDPVFADADDADRVWLVAFTNDAGPVAFYAYDTATGAGSFLFEHQPELSKYELASMEPFSYQSRDGLTINGYLTFPPGADRTGLPTVLLVHGGPWARDTWGFDSEAQWLANRGYLCIQVNFRGSTGYGKAFLNAGDREWGSKMQNDVSDAVAHAISRGWADPARIAIVGGSYGGYAALAGAAFTPDLFCCAVDIVGPSNLITLIETIPPYWAPLDRPVPPAGRRPGGGQGLPLVTVAAVGGRSDPHPAADRPGRERPAGQAGRVGADRRGAGEGRDRARLHAVPGRGSRLRQAGEPAQVLCRGRQVPRRYLGGQRGGGRLRERRAWARCLAPC